MIGILIARQSTLQEANGQQMRTNCIALLIRSSRLTTFMTADVVVVIEQ